MKEVEKLYSNNKEKFVLMLNILEYIVLLAIILECNSMLYVKAEINVYTNMDDFFYSLVWSLLLVILGLHILLYSESLGNYRSYGRIMLLLFLYTVGFYFLNVSHVANYFSQRDYVRKFMVILPLLTLWFIFKREEGKIFDIWLKHSDIVCAYSIINLTIYAISIINTNIIQSEPVYTYWSPLGTLNSLFNVLNVFFIRQKMSWLIAGVLLPRNYGLFIEPLLFTIPLVTALYTEFFLRREAGIKSIARWIILSIALITAHASWGMIILAMGWGLKGILWAVDSGKKYLVAFFIVSVSIACLFAIAQKKSFSYEEETHTSIQAHLEDYQAGIKAFLNKPIAGGGYGNEDYVLEYKTEWSKANNRGFSNSVAVILGEGGILLGLLCMAPFFICFSKIRVQDGLRVAFWGIGTFALYSSIIFFYKLFMIMLFAYGYSLLGVKSISSYLGERNRYQVERRVVKKTVILLLTYALSFVTLVIFGRTVFGFLYKIIRAFQWSIGLSAIKAFFLYVVVAINALLAVWICNHKHNRYFLIPLLLSIGIYCLCYRFLYSAINTFLALKGSWTESGETLFLFVCYLVILGLTWELFDRLTVHTTSFGALKLEAAIIVVLIGLFVGAKFGLNKEIRTIDNDLEVMRVVLDASHGDVYICDRPLLYEMADSRFSLPGTVNEGFSACEDSSIICRKGADLNEMFDSGYAVSELSEDYIVYSNDIGVINSLEDSGYKWYRYYPFERYVDSGVPYILDSGQYALHCEICMDDGCKDGDLDIGKIVISSFYGKYVLNSYVVKATDFDEKGGFAIELQFNLKDLINGVEFKFIPNGNALAAVDKMFYCECPDSITVTSYDTFHYPTKEIFYDTEGDPCRQSDGRYAQESFYDLGGRVKEKRFLGETSQRIIAKDGYSRVVYSYNRQGDVIEEKYFGIDDLPILIKAGYSSVTYLYDENGNRSENCYFDENGELTIINAGYAEIKKQYNSDGYVIREEYYDDLKEKTYKNSGYFAVEYERDTYGKNLREYYYDIANRPCACLQGYHSVSYIRDEYGKVIEEYYYDETGAPITCMNGYYGIKKEYDPNNLLVRLSYIDYSGYPMSDRNGIYVVIKEYDDKKNNIREIYTDKYGNKVCNESGIAEIMRTYDDDGLEVYTIYYNENGKTIEEEKKYAAVKREFDNFNRLKKMTYLDAKGNSVPNLSGIVTVSYSYDKYWNRTEEHYYDELGHIKASTSGIAGIVRTYDARRNVAEKYVDENGEENINSSGIAGILREYDMNGNVICITYIGEQGTAINNFAGVSRIERTYDEYRNIRSEQQYDTLGNKVF